MTSVQPPARVAAVGERELTRDHLAFYRAIIEGVELRPAWERYLRIDGDYNEMGAREALVWVRQALVRIAAASGHGDLIGLLRRDPHRIRASPVPSLDEFAATLPDSGDWSECELIELWNAAHGQADNSRARRQRLLVRMRAALDLLAQATPAAPEAADDVHRWLAPRLAQKLAAAGLVTLGAVRQSLSARKGQRWPAVPGVGEVWARRLDAWLTERRIGSPEPEPEPEQSDHVARLQPFEAMVRGATGLAAAGSQSGHPDDTTKADPYPDVAVVGRWLAQFEGSPHSHRTFRRSAERLLLWLRHEADCRLKDVDTACAARYRVWLSSLGRLGETEWRSLGWKLASADWIGRKSARRDSMDWRPFGGPLGPSSVAQEIANLGLLFDFLMATGQAECNPWRELSASSSSSARAATSRNSRPKGMLPTTSIRTSPGNANRQSAAGKKDSRSPAADTLSRLLSAVPEGPGHRDHRLVLILWLRFACGFKPGQMLRLKVGDFSTSDGRFSVAAPSGGKPTELPYEIVEALEGNLRQLAGEQWSRQSLPILVERLATTALLQGRRGRRPSSGTCAWHPIGPTQLYNIVAGHLRRCSEPQTLPPPTS
ncbi:phage integrase family protein [Derxia gummosa]|uniref:Phage integrase family protein n=1 Tax=Derxia gummosa DSM 723 TaxID=1121388 RepID=A0A8B6XB14_9BURK|nr:phage integrase family protein [Derxia gummosa]